MSVAFEPLKYPPEWRAVVDRHFLLGMPVVGPQERVFRAVSLQLTSRNQTCWAQWGSNKDRVSLAQFAGDALATAAEWPNSYFVPEDPFTLVAWNHNACAIDHLEINDALKSIAARARARLRAKHWETIWVNTFGSVVDYLLQSSRAGVA